MAPRPCIDCGTPTNTTRCEPCEGQRQSTRNQRRTHYHGDWPALSRQLRQQWVEQHGWVCPGWHREPHDATDLVVDHVTPRSRHQLTVLCRSCNSRKSATER